MYEKGLFRGWSVSDHFDVDPKPDMAFHFDADLGPDPNFYFDADPDPAPHQSDAKQKSNELQLFCLFEKYFCWILDSNPT